MKIIIIGSTSGIGKALAKELAQSGHELGLTGRRTPLLEVLQKALSTTVHIQTMDVAETEQARQQFQDLVDAMGGVDCVIINAGIGEITTKWTKEKAIIDVNARGFVAIANAAFYHFLQEGKGHIVGISSIAAIRGSGQFPVYAATKAFISSYMEGLQYRAFQKKKDITITDIRPGFVTTPMTEQNDFMFWVSSAEKAARQIHQAIKRKKKVAYITKRWWLIAFALDLLPDFIVKRFV